MKFDAKIPSGPLADKWTSYRSQMKLLSPANKRKSSVLVVGSGLAGASAAASLSELGYHVKCFCIQDSPRRAHSIAAQGGINAAKNYQNDGDSVWRLFYDTIKGGDFRSREANVHRLAELSTSIIDQCAAQGVPFAREYGGTLANRSFGGVQVSRTFYARGQTGQQLLLGAYSSLVRQMDAGGVEMYPRREMLDLVLVDGKARGITVRNLITGAMESYSADVVVLATGGYSTVYFLSTNAVNCNATAKWRCHKRGALFANPSFTQIHPTALPAAGLGQSKLTLMSESLRNDGRVWVPKGERDTRSPDQIPEAERDYYLERKYPAFGNLVPRDIASRAAQGVCREGRGVGASGQAVYLDFADAIDRLGEPVVRDRYGNLFDMYEEITGENPYHVAMRIFPAPHYTMGGLWVDYNLMSTIPGLFVAGEANFSDHGANRLGASALMQGLADGYFVIPYTVGQYIAGTTLGEASTESEAFRANRNEVQALTEGLLKNRGGKTVLEIHRELGTVMREEVGMSRSAAGLRKAIEQISTLKETFSADAYVSGSGDEFNKNLEMAGRLADYFELGDLMARDALAREESCGGHFREEHQSEEGEALRHDDEFTHVSAWEYTGKEPVMHKEELIFENVQPSVRSYK
jgi:succinate dehydrogenase / fumarate reductase flavoprotein subunit